MYILGVDPSLTSTGLALVGAGRVVRTDRIRSKKTGHARVDEILAGIYNGILEGTLKQGVGGDKLIVGIEGPAMGAKGAAVVQIFGLWGIITHHLHLWEVPYYVVTPTALKKYVTGSGVAGKDEMIAATVRRFPQLDIRYNDEVDALGLACMGARKYDVPIELSLPAVNLTTMSKVEWP